VLPMSYSTASDRSSTRTRPSSRTRCSSWTSTRVTGRSCADPDALGAYQSLKPAAATIAQIAALAVQFGPRSFTFPLIERPFEGIGHEEFWLHNEAIFTATGDGVRSASIYMREYDRKASEPATDSLANNRRSVGLIVL
jgi:hypothetical protein